MRQHTIPTPYMVGDVHIYSVELEGELVLFDTGPDTPAARACLEQELDLERLRHVFVTHCHVDHYGLAWYLAQRSGATIYLPRLDVIKFQQRERRNEGLKQLLLECGFDQDYVETFRSLVAQRHGQPPLPAEFQIIEESRMPETLGFSVMSCAGHSQSDLVFYNDRWAITGDVLLRGIFQAPLLDLDFETGRGRFSNYRAYCAGLGRLTRLRGLEIYPSHRQYIDSLEETVLFYAGKLMERAARIRDFPPEWSVAQVVEQLPGQFDDPFIAYLKASEVYFMRDYLEQPQLLLAALEPLGLRREALLRVPLHLAC